MCGIHVILKAHFNCYSIEKEKMKKKHDKKRKRA
jgi:hypothetical protein